MRGCTVSMRSNICLFQISIGQAIGIVAVLGTAALLLKASHSTWQHSNVLSTDAACGAKHYGPGTSSPYFRARQSLFDSMEVDSKMKAAAFLVLGSPTSQALKVTSAGVSEETDDDVSKIEDLFAFSNGSVKPILKPIDPPVRATILHIDPLFAANVAKVVREVVGKAFPRGGEVSAPRIQSDGDPDMYHMSLYHASNHIHPIPASQAEVAEESRAVEEVCCHLCPIQVSLDRVVITPTGVVLAAWQVTSGSEPAEIRDQLKKVLPKSPREQMYDRVILHTSLARILGPPLKSDSTPVEGLTATADKAKEMIAAVAQTLSKRLCAAQTEVSEFWYVEELDLLALALKGRTKSQPFLLKCAKESWQSP